MQKSRIQERNLDSGYCAIAQRLKTKRVKQIAQK